MPEGETARARHCNETPAEFFWSITPADGKSLTDDYVVSGADKATCTVTPNDIPSIRLTVKMDTGSEYTATYPSN